ncbi:hypothetical protein OKW21_004274 [Catalinimonas alkaloidigena]|uniref:hypothetical protein n=1 Tax=Catalinimonas alkaloidigena TaxID=1075417 RepID=UPI0024050CB8|nr:hypothetical protein [Catalinimonas alkaloidigena]MDF9799011.1 hypothetical protein [Catalinimonas alkaloidigena]
MVVYGKKKGIPLPNKNNFTGAWYVSGLKLSYHEGALYGGIGEDILSSVLYLLERLPQSSRESIAFHIKRRDAAYL